MTNKEFDLPFFDGFYNTIHEFDSEDGLVDDFNEDNEDNGIIIDKEAIIDNFDYKRYYKDYSRFYVDAFNTSYSDILKPYGINNIKFKELAQPREYNFENDTIYATADIDLEIFQSKIIDFIQDNYDFIEKKINKTFSSYDGFISFHSDHIDEWLRKLEDRIDEINNLEISFIIKQIILLETKNEYSEIVNELHWDTDGDMCYFTYLSDKIRKKDRI